jgi:hypothetical protein
VNYAHRLRADLKKHVRLLIHCSEQNKQQAVVPSMVFMAVSDSKKRGKAINKMCKLEVVAIKKSPSVETGHQGEFDWQKARRT